MAMLFSVMSFAAEATATISFADKAQRTEYSTDKQVWEQNGIVVTNDKASSTSNVGDYANPARFYKSSKVTIQCTLGNITKIEISNCGDNKYATPWNTNNEAAVSGTTATITPKTVSDTYTIAALNAQARAGQMVITYEVAEGGFVSTPTIEGEQYFKESATVSMKAAEGLKVYYTLDGTDPTTASTEYTASFEVKETTTVKAIAYDGENASDVVTVVFKKMQVLTCAEAAAITPTGDKYIVRGYVTSAEEYATDFNNIEFFMADTKDGGEVLKVYRAVAVTEDDKAVKVGDYVEVIGELAVYSGAVQVTSGGKYTIIPEPAPEEPTYEVFEEEITDLVVDVEAMTISGGPSANYMVKVILGLGDYDRNEGTYQLLPESYVSIQGTDATFVDGYVAELDAFTPSAKAVVRCVWNGMNVELHLNMSAAPMEATVVVVENATAKVEKYLLFGEMYDYSLTLTGKWLNPEDGLTYPVLVEVPVYYPESTEPSEIMSTVTVGGWGDEDPWLGFGEGTLTITTVGDVITATGVVQNPMAGIAIDITITGKISTGHTVTILVTPEGAGTVTGAGEYENGTEVTVTAEENDEWVFMGWLDATTNEFVAYDYEYTFTVLEDVELVAYYLPYLEGESTDLVIGKNTLTASAELSIGLLKMNLVLGEEVEGMYMLTEASTLTVDDKAATFAEGIAMVSIEYQMAVAAMIMEYNDELYYVEVMMVAPETGVDNIQVENVAVKMIKNGQLIIIKNGVEYNVQGAILK